MGLWPSPNGSVSKLDSMSYSFNKTNFKAVALR